MAHALCMWVVVVLGKNATVTYFSTLSLEKISCILDRMSWPRNIMRAHTRSNTSISQPCLDLRSVGVFFRFSHSSRNHSMSGSFFQTGDEWKWQKVEIVALSNADYLPIYWPLLWLNKFDFSSAPESPLRVQSVLSLIPYRGEWLVNITGEWRWICWTVNEFDKHWLLGFNLSVLACIAFVVVWQFFVFFSQRLGV